MRPTGHRTSFPTAAAAVAALLLLLPLPVPSDGLNLFPQIEVTLANDGSIPVWFMCQMTNQSNSLSRLDPDTTYRFNFTQVAFPMRWCYLYISRSSHGFFWAFTIRSGCTKCFWSINHQPSLYRGDKGRWERQKLFMPPNFDIANYTSGPVVDRGRGGDGGAEVDDR